MLLPKVFGSQKKMDWLPVDKVYVSSRNFVAFDQNSSVTHRPDCIESSVGTPVFHITSSNFNDLLLVTLLYMDIDAQISLVYRIGFCAQGAV